MSTIEAPEIIEGELDIPSMVAHLYDRKPRILALCGVVTAQTDPHRHMHYAEGIEFPTWRPGIKECSCGAPVCQDCYAFAIKAMAHIAKRRGL